jgi:flagellar L-ring protein precursor FlgH
MPPVSGARAQRVGDVLTILLSESTSTAKTIGHQDPAQWQRQHHAPTLGRSHDLDAP